MSRPSVYVHGTAMEISWRDERRSLTELIFDTVHRAIERTPEIPFEDIDSVVLAAHDLVDGRSLSSMVTAPAAACYLRDEIRLGDDSAAALAAAVARLEAGYGKHCIVAGWGRTSEHRPDDVSRALFDPFYMRPFGMREIDVSAFRANKWLGAGAGRAEYREAAMVRRERAVANNPRALHIGGGAIAAPGGLDDREIALGADVVTAAIISLDESDVRIGGVAQSSEPYHPGTRDLLGMPSLKLATELALREAARTVSEVDVIELDGLTLFDEAIGLEAIGRVGVGEGLRALAEDESLLPSGGGRGGYCAPAMGLARVVESVLQLRGTAGAVQTGRPRTALATGASIVGGQTHTSVILEAA